jgi:hypothetical protein
VTADELAALAAATVAAGLCGAVQQEHGGGVCQLDPHRKKPHRARVGPRVELPGGVVWRKVVEWREPARGAP